MAARAFSGDDASSTTAAANIDPVPAKISARPTPYRPMPQITIPVTVMIARKRFGEALIERQLLGCQRLLR
jgi:hypothetical protein